MSWPASSARSTSGTTVSSKPTMPGSDGSPAARRAIRFCRISVLTLRWTCPDARSSPRVAMDGRSCHFLDATSRVVIPLRARVRIGLGRRRPIPASLRAAGSANLDDMTQTITRLHVHAIDPRGSPRCGRRVRRARQRVRPDRPRRDGEPLRCCLRSRRRRRVHRAHLLRAVPPAVAVARGRPGVRSRRAVRRVPAPVDELPAELRTGPRVLRTYRADGSLDYDHITIVRRRRGHRRPRSRAARGARRRDGARARACRRNASPTQSVTSR